MSDLTCYAGCYRFPHRFGGGLCSGSAWVQAYFDPWRAECRGCNNMVDQACQVVDGTEGVWHCPELRDMVRYEGIQLYGKARDAFKRATRSR